MRQRTYGGVGSPAREGGLTRLQSLYKTINGQLNRLQGNSFGGISIQL